MPPDRQAIPKTYRSAEPRNLRAKNDHITPFRSASTKAPNDPPQRRGLSETKLRQTRLSDAFNPKPAWTDPPKRRRRDAETSASTSREPISQLKLVGRTKPATPRDEEPHSKKPAQYFQAYVDDEAVVGRSTDASRRKARHSEYLGRSRTSPNSDQHLDIMSTRKTTEMPETVETGHLTVHSKRIGRMSSAEVIETENNHLTVTKTAYPTISSDTIEQPHTSSLDTTPPPPVSPQRSPIPQQTLFSLGIDLNSQCSPLTYQVLHPKDKIRSVNRGHGGWLEATQETHTVGPEEDDLFNFLPAPIAKQSRHRVVSNELLCLPGDLNTSQRPDEAPVSEIITDLQHCDPGILPIELDIPADHYEIEFQPDHDGIQHTPKSRVLCEASPTPKLLSSQAKQHANRINVIDLEPCVLPSQPTEHLALRSLRSRSPVEHPEDPKTVSADGDMLMSSPAPAPSQDGEKTFFFPESMALGISDWEDLGEKSPSPQVLSRVEEVLEQSTALTPQRSCSIPDNQLGFLDEHEASPSPIPPSKVVLAEETQEMTPERPSKCIKTPDELSKCSPVPPSHVVLVEETQEMSPEPPSKRSKTLDEPSQSSSHRKPLIRSLAPPTPISVRIRQQQEMSALREQRTLSKSANSARVASSNVSPHKPWSPSPLKKVKNAGSWKERNRQAWTTHPEAQIVNAPFDRQSNITEFFNNPGPSTSSVSTNQKSKDPASVSQDKLTKALFQEKAMSRLFGNTSPLKKTNPDHQEENDDIEDIDITVSDSQRDPEGKRCEDSQDEKEPTRADFEKCLERKRHRRRLYGFDLSQNLSDQQELLNTNNVFEAGKVHDNDQLVSDDFDVHF